MLSDKYLTLFLLPLIVPVASHLIINTNIVLELWCRSIIRPLFSGFRLLEIIFRVNCVNKPERFHSY